MSNYMSDLGVYLNSGANIVPDTSTSRANNTELSFTDMLTLMVVQLQNQTMDDTADTSQMLSQMIQMQVVQSITDITDATVMTYASSLVGKEVTVGTYNSRGELEERVLTITGTGYSDGNQVLFAGDEVISLGSIMAVGRLPSVDSSASTGGSNDKVEEPGEVPDHSGSGESDKNVDDADGSGEVQAPEDVGELPDNSGEVPDDRPVDAPDETEQDNSASDENQDVVDPAAGAEQTT